MLSLFSVGSFSYTAHAGFSFFFSFFFFLSLSLFFFFFFFFVDQGSFSHTSRASFIVIWGLSLQHRIMASFLCGEFLLHIHCSAYFYLGSFSYTSHACFIFLPGVCLTHPVQPLFLYGEFLLHIRCWLLFGEFLLLIYADFFCFIRRVSLTYPMLGLFFLT